ncbi:MAG: hypothetical protein IH620_06215 [Ignavibacterium sp.]|nr:hypothetical protein [Ignavibacterium sp.]
MKISVYYVSLLFTIIMSTSTFSQSSSDWFLLPDGLGLSNQLEYSYNIDNKIEIFENWLTLDYNKNIFSAGLRFEAFQPNDPDPSISRGKVRYADIAYKYFAVDIGDVEEGLNITVGNFYKLFGRGLILKSYEDRNIRVDNNLLGVKVEANYMGFTLAALSGSASNSINERQDIIHAVDLQYNGFDFVKLGTTFASNQPAIVGTARTTLASARIQPTIWNFDGYAEYGIKSNKDIQSQIFEDDEWKIGEAFYGSLNFYYDMFSIVGEYKYYDNYAFTSNDGTIFYNTAPSLRKEYTYQLLNRHPSPLDQSNEEGYSFEANFNLSDATSVIANYGITQTLPASSYYQRVNNFSLPITTQLKEFYLQATHSWNESFTTIAAFGYNEELSTNTKNFTPILENKFYFDEINTIKLVLEHQQTENLTTDEKYYDDVIAIEYLRSPGFNVSLVTEIQTKEPEAGKTVRKVWSFLQFGYKLGNHSDLSLLIGSRQAGNICIGGICRYEPAFQGIEFKILTRL